MPEDWSIKKIGDIGQVIGGGTPPTKDKLYYGGKIPWITPKDLSDHKFTFIERGERNITKIGLNNSSARLLPGGTVLFTSRAPIGYVAIAKTAVSTNQGFKSIICNPQKAYNKFIYYALKYYKDKIENVASGSTFKEISGTTLKNFEILLPPLDEQEVIADRLFSIDSKIGLNHQMNKTLEAIGQALFKHWFVDFEFPNEEGKPYKSSGGEMVDSELGEIPKGWEVGTLGDICEITMGQSPPGKTYNEIGKGTPFYQGNRDFGFRFPTRRVYCTAPTRFAEEGNVLLSVRAPVGNLNVAEERCAIGRGVAALRLNGKQHGYLYYLLRATQSGWNEFEAEGTVFGSANKSDVQGFKVVIPPNKSKEQFASLIKSLDDQIINNEKQSRALISIRDTLLPKLMSGELRVSATGKLPEVIE